MNRKDRILEVLNNNSSYTYTDKDDLYIELDNLINDLNMEYAYNMHDPN